MPQVTIPELNNINRQAGSLVLTIDDPSANAANLLRVGPFLLRKEATAFTLQTSSTNTQKQMTLNSNTVGNITLIWTWIKNNHRLISINNTTGEVRSTVKENSLLNESFGLIDLVNPIITGNGLSKQTITQGNPNLAKNPKKGWTSTVYSIAQETMIADWIVGEKYTVTIKGTVNEGQKFGIWRDFGVTLLGHLTPNAAKTLWTGTFIVPETTATEKNAFSIYNSPFSETWSATIEWLKIEKGAVSTANQMPSPEYTSAIASIPKTFVLKNNATNLESIASLEPLRSIGTVKDTLYFDIDNLWKISRKVGEYAFTGDEALTTIIRNSTTMFVSTTNIGAVAKSSDNIDILSTHFMPKAIYELDEEGVYLNPKGLFRLSINSYRLETTNSAGLKKWLTGKGVKIQFQLAVPKIEILPASEQLKLNRLKTNLKGNALSITSGSLISVSNPPLFTGNYQKLGIYAQDILYDSASSQLITKLKNSGTVLFDADYTRPMHYAKKPYLEATMAPRDNSPILVNNEEGPMQRQYFFDHITGLYDETNTESFVYRGENELAVSYDKLDPTYIVTVRCGAESIGEPVTVINNRILLTMTPEQKEYWYGKTFDVTYRLASSYTVEYNEQSAHDSYLVRLENHQDQEVTITQEGNRFSSQRLMKEIELNPIVNPQHTGFMYISKEEQVSQAFRLTLSSNYIIANGLDSADFIVEVIDQDGNEVLSPYVDVFIMNELGLVTSQFGSFTPIINKDTLKAKNAAGRSYYKYQAPLIRKGDTKKTQKVFAVAYDRKHKIGAQVPLILRPSEPVYDVTGTNYLKINLPLQTRSDASIVFEYFARYYEKPIPSGHPILLLDSDGDGVLTYTDLNQFLIEQTNAVRMQEIAYALRETEAF